MTFILWQWRKAPLKILQPLNFMRKKYCSSSMGNWFVLIPTVSLRLPLWGVQVRAVHGIWASFLTCKHANSKRYPAQQLIKTITYPISQLTLNLHQTMAKCTNPHNEYVSNRLKLAYMSPSSRRCICKQDPWVSAVELYWWSLLCCRWLMCTSRSQLHCVITICDWNVENGSLSWFNFPPATCKA